MFTAQVIGTIHNVEIRTINERQYIAFDVAHRMTNDDTVWVSCRYRYTDGRESFYNVLKDRAKMVFVQGDVTVRGYAKRDGGNGVDVTLWVSQVQVTAFKDAEPKPEGKPEPAKEEKKEVDDLPF